MTTTLPFSAFVIAAPKSNSGKTIITLGLLQALKKRGLATQAFKSGPDYIDPQHHSAISGRASYNLDCWMASETHVRELFAQKTQDATIAIVEGAMGLFDGAKKDKGSVADLAKLLHLPVVLVVDASSTAYSIAPLLYGFKNFDKNIHLAGIIFNKVGSPSHYEFLKSAADDVGVTTLGYIPRDKQLTIDSRHLGLHMPQDIKTTHPITIASTLIEKYVDINKLCEITTTQKPPYQTQVTQKGKLRIAFASDEAFNFSYPANKDMLSRFGELIFFSPLHDTELPDADLVWLSGGYPELFLKELEANESMKLQIAQHIDSGKALVAECGGMMYLGKYITNKEGDTAKMTGVLQVITSFEKMKLHLGYRQIINTNGKEWFGHEFHYSDYSGTENHNEKYTVKNARNKTIETPIYRVKNCWASYLHLYLGEEDKMRDFLQELKLSV